MTSCYSPYSLTSQGDDDYTQCNIRCVQPEPYSRLDNVCVQYCPAGTYLSDFVCKLSCPKYMKYAILESSGQYICSDQCPNKIYSKLSQVQAYFCQTACLSPYVFRNDIYSGQIECLIKCDQTEYLYTTGECSKYNCIRDPVNKFSLNMVCVSKCPEFVDISDYSCKSTCTGSFSGFVQQIVLGQNVHVCYLNCPTKFVDMRPAAIHKSVGACSSYCPKTDSIFQEPYSPTQFYCTLCQNSNQFVQLDLIYCKNTCASTFFKVIDGRNYCTPSCNMPLGRTKIDIDLIKCSSCLNYVSEVDQACIDTCDFYNVYNDAQVCRMKDNQRNPDSCPSYSGDAAPYLCIMACYTMRDGPRCVVNCSVTGKRFIPDVGFDCAESCPNFYSYQLVFGIEQPRCVPTCEYMRSTGDLKECQQMCYSNSSVYVFGLTFCSNCSSTQKLQIEDNLKFTCVDSCSDNFYQIQNLCTFNQCGQTKVQTSLQELTGFICFDKFSYNYSSTIKKYTNKVLNVSQIQVSNSKITVLLSNGSIFTVDDNQQSSISMHNAVQISLIATPPSFQSQKLLIKFENGTIFVNNMKERTDFTKETVKRIIGFFDPLVPDNSINYLLTDENLYFRGSCKAGMCTKDENGNDFDTEFNGKTKFRGMWTKMNLQAASFPFVAADIDDIKELDWSILFLLKNNQKFVFGINSYGRLCKDPNIKIALTDVSAYTQISVGNTTTLLSQNELLFFCGASFGDFDLDTNELKLSPEKLTVEFGGLLGWTFVENAITQITYVNNGFIIQTNAQVLGIGQCIAFDCYNFRGEQMFYTGYVQKLKWLSQNLMVLGTQKINVQYYKQPLKVEYFNDTKELETDLQNQNGTIGIVKSGAIGNNVGLKVAIGITSCLYAIAIFVVARVLRKIFNDRKNAVLTNVRKPKDQSSLIIKMKPKESIFNPLDEYQYVI
ncbi:Conserved_hypothetical protein [Hexamita inflata]|uniref:Transmembrane protein n=1 Tax=Hexamita inflata TaxID=28002 RepID=A0AA86U0L9_9EUKA|nr:Conserved hypothetical protein [Hexamita inflata]CAI9953959.1 Conserved hypothetical protein [Hexamita inflata]